MNITTKTLKCIKGNSLWSTDACYPAKVIREGKNGRVFGIFCDQDYLYSTHEELESAGTTPYSIFENKFNNTITDTAFMNDQAEFICIE